MPTYDQIEIFFSVLFRIVIEIFFILFSIILLAGVLAKSFRWSFSKKETEDTTTYKIKAEKR